VLAVERSRRMVNGLAVEVLAGNDDPLGNVREPAQEYGGGVYLRLRADGDWQLSRPERAVLLLRPPRSGKTSGVIIPGLLAHTGPAACTSTKPDVARATRRARSRFGRVWVFDPTGANRGAGAEELRWSPVRASARWDGALLMARAMTAGVGDGTVHGSHWAKRSQALLASFLHAAALDGRDMESVVDWVMRHELDEAHCVVDDDDTRPGALAPRCRQVGRKLTLGWDHHLSHHVSLDAGGRPGRSALVAPLDTTLAASRLPQSWARASSPAEGAVRALRDETLAVVQPGTRSSSAPLPL
jgi:hypothetical protein